MRLFRIGIVTALSLGGCLANSPPALVLAPAPFAEHAAQCSGKDGFSDPAPPVRVFANVYDVGTCGIVSLLLVGDKGHILIDAATVEAAPQILANIRRLGVNPGDVKIALVSHAHNDHAGGLAGVVAATGAQLLARSEAKAALETGGPQPDDPQYLLDSHFPGVRVAQEVRDEEVVQLGNLSVTIHATPGHTSGSTSFSWRSCDDWNCRQMVYADSVTAISSDDYRFTANPTYVQAFRKGLAKIASLDCEILITPHPGQSNLYQRLSGAAPLVDVGACRYYSLTGAQRLQSRLNEEQAD